MAHDLRRHRPPEVNAFPRPNGPGGARQESRPTSAGQPVATFRVIKKLAPDRRGAKGLAAEYGEQLVCIRHRVDPTVTLRLTTVELVIAQRPIARRPSPMVDLAIRPQERELQARLKAAGARWDAMEKVWRIRRATAIALGLKKRIVP